MDQTIENLVDAVHTRMSNAAEKMDQIREQMRQMRESVAACQANTRTVRALIQSVRLEPMENADKVAVMRHKLQEMQAKSNWDGMPESLDAYFYDAIQAMTRLERQLRSAKSVDSPNL